MLLPNASATTIAKRLNDVGAEAGTFMTERCLGWRQRYARCQCALIGHLTAGD